MSLPRKLVLVVIDGLTPTMLEASLGTASTPTLTALAERAVLGRATSTFPSLTPVCLSSIATGAHPDVHEIPHLIWWHRGERRLVEYGSSFGAVRAAGLGRALRDTLVGMNAEHLGRNAVTVFEALADAGVRTAAVNFTAYRGRTLHRPTVPFLGPVLGPERFFFYNLFQSERTGAPLSFRNRAAGTIDAYAAAVGRWLVTRDGFDFLLLYLSDYDYASHVLGPDASTAVLARCDEAIGDLVRAAGGVDEFLARYALIVMSDHGQTVVREVARLEDRFRHEPETLVAASARTPRTREPWPSGSTASRRSRSCSSGRTASRSLAVRAPSYGWAGRWCSTAIPPCSTTRTPSRAPRRPSAVAMPATWSSPPRRPGSSKTSAAVTTSGAGRTDLSSRGIRSCRC